MSKPLLPISGTAFVKFIGYIARRPRLCPFFRPVPSESSAISKYSAVSSTTIVLILLISLSGKSWQKALIKLSDKHCLRRSCSLSRCTFTVACFSDASSPLVIKESTNAELASIFSHTTAKELVMPA